MLVDTLGVIIINISFRLTGSVFSLVREKFFALRTCCFPFGHSSHLLSIWTAVLRAPSTCKVPSGCLTRGISVSLTCTLHSSLGLSACPRQALSFAIRVLSSSLWDLLSLGSLRTGLWFLPLACLRSACHCFWTLIAVL